MGHPSKIQSPRVLVPETFAHVPSDFFVERGDIDAARRMTVRIESYSATGLRFVGVDGKRLVVSATRVAHVVRAAAE